MAAFQTALSAIASTRTDARRLALQLAKQALQLPVQRCHLTISRGGSQPGLDPKRDYPNHLGSNDTEHPLRGQPACGIMGWTPQPLRCSVMPGLGLRSRSIFAPLAAPNLIAASPCPIFVARSSRSPFLHGITAWELHGRPQLPWGPDPLAPVHLQPRVPNHFTTLSYATRGRKDAEKMQVCGHSAGRCGDDDSRRD